MKQWLEEHGTPALRRAFEEGYEVAKGIGDLLVSDIRDSLDMTMHTEWSQVEERTSPNAESFSKRDLVVACAKSLESPDGWSKDVSRISRIYVTEDIKTTGVIFTVRDADRKQVKQLAIDFEN